MSASAALTSCNINGKRCSHCKQLIGTCNKMVSTGSAVESQKSMLLIISQQSAPSAQAVSHAEATSLSP